MSAVEEMVHFRGMNAEEQAEAFFAEHFAHGATGSMWTEVVCLPCERYWTYDGQRRGRRRW